MPLQSHLPTYVRVTIRVLVEHKHREDILGDLEEEFVLDTRNEGESVAHRRLAVNLARSLAPFLWRRLKQIVFMIKLLERFWPE
jgi:hypothetical protein